MSAIEANVLKPTSLLSNSPFEVLTLPYARQAEVSAVAEVTRGRVPFQNWFEPGMGCQDQLQTPGQPDAMGRDSSLQ